MSPQAVALIGALLFLAVAFAFDLYCLRDLKEAPFVFVFPPETWFYAILFATPRHGLPDDRTTTLTRSRRRRPDGRAV